MKNKKKKVSSNKAFDMMNTVADKSNVDINNMGDIDKSTKGIHNALMAAGMTPAYGNVADLADATLYALEGEFGDAAWSAAAAIPVIGQMVAGKRALKIAKESGEEMVTLYRGVDKWHAGSMVKDGKFIGGGKWYKDSREFISGATRKKEGIFTSKKKHMAEVNFNSPHKLDNELLLEFEVPKSYISKYSKEGWYPDDVLFEKGIPKEFLKKVHK
jgi:hypothetical protein